MMLTLVVGALPVLGLLLWWWNDIWHALPTIFRLSGTGVKLPPGHMGLPFFGEMITFLWYFKVLRRPDDFINYKRRKYGDGVGLYRSHLFGSPTIIACFPLVNKYVLQSDDKFISKWPNVDIVGRTALVSVNGEAHTRLRTYITNAINKPNALRRIAGRVQPRLVAAFQSWAQRGKIKGVNETKKVTFENIGELFVSFKPGPKLEAMDKLFVGLLQGLRAQAFNFPGSAYRHALQCKKKLGMIFKEELEKRKSENKSSSGNGDEKEDEKVNDIDLMEGLMQFKDEQGNQLSDQEVIDNIVGFVVAGYESTALASAWALYYLAKYPNVLQKLREENMAMSKKKKGDFLTHADVSTLKYTNKVVEETIRMANVAAFIFRHATEDVEYKGYKIPKNWNVILWTRYLHTHSENFEDPMCFNPDRWDEPAKPGTYQVFGGGRRICAGNMLARLQLALFLHHLSLGYKWELQNPNAEIIYLSHPKPVDGVELIFGKI